MNGDEVDTAAIRGYADLSEDGDVYYEVIALCDALDAARDEVPRLKRQVAAVRAWYRYTNAGKLHGSHILWLAALDGAAPPAVLSIAEAQARAAAISASAAAERLPPAAPTHKFVPTRVGITALCMADGEPVGYCGRLASDPIHG